MFVNLQNDIISQTICKQPWYIINDVLCHRDAIILNYCKVDKAINNQSLIIYSFIYFTMPSIYYGVCDMRHISKTVTEQFLIEDGHFDFTLLPLIQSRIYSGLSTTHKTMH